MHSCSDCSFKAKVIFLPCAGHVCAALDWSPFLAVHSAKHPSSEGYLIFTRELSVLGFIPFST